MSAAPQLQQQRFPERPALTSFYSRYGKRLLDVSAALVLLALLAPIIALAALLVLVLNGRPVIFRQTRVAKGDSTFSIFKFRTMQPRSERVSHITQPRDPRVTRLGRILRQCYLDELPQLWNVLVGDMSLIGPRPLTPRQCREISQRIHDFSARHGVHPGLSGRAQLCGRYDLDPQNWEIAFAADIRYMERLTLMEDLRILLRTIKSVCTRRGT